MIEKQENEKYERKLKEKLGAVELKYETVVTPNGFI